MFGPDLILPREHLATLDAIRREGGTAHVWENLRPHAGKWLVPWAISPLLCVFLMAVPGFVLPDTGRFCSFQLSGVIS